MRGTPEKSLSHRKLGSSNPEVVLRNIRPTDGRKMMRNFPFLKTDFCSGRSQEGVRRSTERRSGQCQKRTLGKKRATQGKS